MQTVTRRILTKEQIERSRKIPTNELLNMALTMLDKAAEEQIGEDEWLHNNMTLEVIRDRIKNNI